MTNVHDRTIATPAARVGALLDTLASADADLLSHVAPLGWEHIGLTDETAEPINCRKSRMSIGVQL